MARYQAKENMLSMFEKNQFTIKLFITIVFIFIASVVTIAGIAIKMSHEGIKQLGKTAIANTYQAVFNPLNMYDTRLRR